MFRQTVLFNGKDAGGQNGLWQTNGTAAGTHELTGISSANAGGLFSSFIAPDMTVFNGEVLFEGFNASGNAGLWVTDGTAPSTSELTGISGANASGIGPSDLTVFGSEVLFEGENASAN